jgi:hypothetical protein
VTTGQASFCGNQDGGVCQPCTKDQDCVARGFGQGAACVVCAGCGGPGNPGATGCSPAAA